MAATVQGAQAAHEAEHKWIRLAGLVVLVLGLWHICTEARKKL